jgi:DNA polymerase (family X)
MENREIARVFQEIADILEIQDANPFRVRSYRRAAQVVESLAFDIEGALKSDPDRIRSLPGIGAGTFEKIQELVQTGSCREHEELQAQIPGSLLNLLDLQNLGPKKIALFWKELKIGDIEQLEDAARKHRLQSLPGMGEKSEEKILKAIQEYRSRQGRFRIDFVDETADKIIQYLKGAVEIDRISIAGSLRRRRETIGDLDLLVTCRNPEDAMEKFIQYPEVREVLARGETKASVVTRASLQIDLRVLEPESFGAALQYFTGSKEHNVALRERAKRMGLKINEYGLFEVETDKKVAGREEAEIYERLGLPPIPTELRENRGEIERAEAGELPSLLELNDLRGDLHMHTTASDGQNTVQEMAEAAARRGYQYISITDHSKSLAMTGGLDEKRLRQQIEEIEKIRKKDPGIEILKGIEVDILAAGELDLSDEVLSELDVVIASIHSRFNLGRKEMTARICHALENPHVNILAHPTGRLILKREPYQVDLEQVVAVAVENRVCLEVNAYPARLDLNDVHVRMARDMGALISVNSDSHHTEMLGYISYGVDTARRGWLEKEDVINTFPISRLRKILRKESYRG